jgi:multicomponent Na+:H+ antiporter subunit G
MFDAVIDVASWVLLTAGGLFVLIGGVGALRMPDLYTRMHAASLTDSFGPLLVLGGLALQAGWTLETAKLFIILLFTLITGPTATYALANAAFTAGIRGHGQGQEPEGR